MAGIGMNVDLNEWKCWPFHGFAPGGYQCKCIYCDQIFQGDKRASSCLPCTIRNAKRTIEQQIQRLKQEPDERVVAAAVYHGVVVSLPPPARHHTIMHFMSAAMKIDTATVAEVNQGFITSTGRFVNRTEAYYIAFKAGQLKHQQQPDSSPELFSEDLW